MFGRAIDKPFGPTSVGDRADAAWKRMGLDRITLHQARHTYTSLMIAAGVNAKALSTYSHAGIQITLDRYGHLMPGNEDEAAGLLHGYRAGEHQGQDRPACLTVPSERWTWQFAGVPCLTGRLLVRRPVTR